MAVYKFTHNPLTSHVHNLKASLSARSRSRRTSKEFRDKETWDFIQGSQSNGKEAHKEDLKDSEPSEKLFYILSVLGTSWCNSNDSTPRVQSPQVCQRTMSAANLRAKWNIWGRKIDKSAKKAWIFQIKKKEKRNVRDKSHKIIQNIIREYFCT